MQNNLICSEIIPQIDPNVQNAINILKSEMQKIQNSEIMKQARDMAEQYFINLHEIEGHSELLEIANTVIDKLHEIKGYSEMIEKSNVFNEQIKTLLEKAVVIVKKRVVNIYKKIISCSRAVRSHNKVSTFSKSSSGDSGDSDQPEPPRSHYLTIPQSQQNSYIHSWRTTPGYCGMPGGGQR